MQRLSLDLEAAKVQFPKVRKGQASSWKAQLLLSSVLVAAPLIASAQQQSAADDKDIPLVSGATTPVPRARRCYVPSFVRGPLPAVCHAMEQNLNEFCDQPPMVCSLRVSPKVPQMSLPQTVNLDIAGNMSLIERLVRGNALYLSHVSSNTDRAWNEMKGRLDRVVPLGLASLKRAEVDLFNQGEAEAAYFLDDGSCENINFGEGRNEPRWKDLFERMPPYQRFTKVGQQILLQRHANIFDDPVVKFRAEEGQQAFAGANLLGGTNVLSASVFMHEGTAYMFLWSGRAIVIDRFSTDRTKLLDRSVTPRSDAVEREQVCAFEYLGSGN